MGTSGTLQAVEKRPLSSYSGWSRLWRETIRLWPILLLAPTVLWLRGGQDLILTLDEGIYLDGGMRVLRGQVPYRDFFVLTGPGTFWLSALLFKCFGPTLGVARILACLDAGVVLACINWLVTKRARLGMAAVTTVLFFGFELCRHGQLTVNHRWDSLALVMLSVALGFWALRTRSAVSWGISGALAAAAAWCTPPVGLVLLAMVAFLAFYRDLRPYLRPYLAGTAAVSAALAALLFILGGLWSMMRHMLWTASNYAGANRVHYGAIIGGWDPLIAMYPRIKGAFIGVILAFIAISAILPVVIYACAPFVWLRRLKGQDLREVVFMLACSAGLLISAAPHWDIGHLSYASPPFYVMLAWMMNLDSALLRKGVGAIMIVFALLFVVKSHRVTPVRLQTPFGQVRGSAEDAALVSKAMAHAPAGTSLFVYPYLPFLYPVTGGVNPARYSFLQPGMSTPEDEASVLAALERNPPERIIYQDVPPESYLRIWPHGDRSRLRMQSIEDFIRSRYIATDQYRGYRFLVRR